jgi:hypothetical protein
MNIRRTLRAQIAAAMIAIAIAFVPLGVANAGADVKPPAHPVIIQGAGLAAAGVAAASVDPNVDFWPIYSESTIDNQSSHGLSGAIWPGFLLDAFAWLYGLQPQERAGLGISESQWPNPPHTSSASSTGFMLKNFADGCAMFFGPEQCAQAFATFGEPPAALGTSSSHSALLDSSGQARGARFDFPGVLEAAEARSRTATRFENGKTVVESVFTARNVTIGGSLHIDLVEARSVAMAAGDRVHSSGKSTLKIVGADFAGTPVFIDDQGLHASGDGGTDDFNKALAAEGLEVRGSQGRETVDSTGEFVDSSSGGLLVRVSRQRAEDSFPAPLIEGKNAACASAEQSPLNSEITRIRFDQPNPLFGTVPIPGMPKRAQVDQSVPPPVQCPFTNRNLGVTLVLGLTDASARLSPLPDIAVLGGAVAATVGIPGTPGYTVPGRAGTPASLAIGVPESRNDVAQSTLASSPHKTGDLAHRVRILYGLIALVVALGVAGRFVLRTVSSP